MLCGHVLRHCHERQFLPLRAQNSSYDSGSDDRASSELSKRTKRQPLNSRQSITCSTSAASWKLPFRKHRQHCMERESIMCEFWRRAYDRSRIYSAHWQCMRSWQPILASIGIVRIPVMPIGSASSAPLRSGHKGKSLCRVLNEVFEVP